MRYHLMVIADNEEKTVLMDEIKESKWSFDRIDSWLQRKYYGQWKKITITDTMV